MPRIATTWRRSDRLARWAWSGVALILIGLGAAALGPPTDIDSLDYHLGVPLDWLRHGAAVARHDWLHARLAGLGESLNLLGLALGTDNLGAVLQFAGLLIAVLVVVDLAADDRGRVLGAVLVAACPVMAQLVPNQKFQLFPSTATLLAVVLIVRNRRGAADPATLGLAFGCAACAMGCKYNFLITGGVVIATGVALAVRSQCGWKAAVLAGGAGIVIAGPVFLGNLLQYGDPISPFLERWQESPDPLVVAFADRLRNLEGDRSARSYARLAVTAVVPTGPGVVTAVLGVGALAFVLALLDRRTDRLLLMLVGAATISILLFVQLAPRFLLEPYLWCSVAVVLTPWRGIKTVLLWTMTIQATVVAAIALFGGATLGVGSLCDSQRDRVLRAAAADYSAARWLDEILPANAIVLTDRRTSALTPRPFVSRDLPLLLSQSTLDADQGSRRLLRAVRRQRVTHIVRAIPLEWIGDPDLVGRLAARFRGTVYEGLIGSLGRSIAVPEPFPLATRNPWNRAGRFALAVIEIEQSPSMDPTRVD